MFGLRKWFKREPASWHQVDRLQAACAQLPQTEMPLTHLFTPGLYAREIFVPKGTLVVTKIHKKEHPFVILAGSANIWTADSGVVTLSAPYVGVTKAGTRRVLLTTEDCRWITFHPTMETDLDKLEEELIVPRDVKAALGEREMTQLLKEAA